ncbi:MAG: hypothetical protein L0Y44_16370 [Phycisphaerales bacterium]|nr:hypothetical protein [Phycisphaerales bacterium]
MTDPARSEDGYAAKLRERQWQIIEELRRQGDPTAKLMIEIMEKIMREEENADPAEDRPLE